jgi:tetraacyldisaccharide-1-P 4'-kinase
LAAYIATGLKQRGRSVALVTMGYGRPVGGRCTAPGTGPVDARRVGDEAAELASATGLDVHVGDDPASVIAELDQTGGVEWIVFDNGVSRSWDGEGRVVAFTAEDLDRRVRFIPDGRWRAEPEFVRRACIVAVRAVSAPDESRQAADRLVLTQWGYSGPVAWFCVEPLGWQKAGKEGATLPSVPDGPPLMFCGLGAPHQFIGQLERMGVRPIDTVIYSDHHNYTSCDMAYLEKRACRAGARWLCTTHKDAVKIDPGWMRGMPIWFPRVAVREVAGDDLIATLSGAS